MIAVPKKEVHAFCENYVNSRLERIHSEIKKLNEGLQSETKSTAGDKHETGRAMLQLEREKLGKQLLEVENMKLVMGRISPNQESEKIALGSLVRTDKARYFISISAGKFRLQNTDVYCISTSSPIGKILLGKEEGDVILFNGSEQMILGAR
ncbi:MAG: 3-oxoacyl-ACP synthase [Bacteroidota bacterium]